MAQALRTVWLEPEEQQEPLAPQLHPRRRRQPASAVRQGPLVTVSLFAMVAVAVGLMVAYISSYARIAEYEFQRQAMTTELSQLQNECSQMELNVARLENTQRIAEKAQAQALEFPTADRVHYVQLTPEQATPLVENASQPHQSWFARTGNRVLAHLDSMAQRLGRGPGTPAYAQQ